MSEIRSTHARDFRQAFRARLRCVFSRTISSAQITRGYSVRRDHEEPTDIHAPSPKNIITVIADEIPYKRRGAAMKLLFRHVEVFRKKGSQNDSCIETEGPICDIK